MTTVPSLPYFLLSRLLNSFLLVWHLSIFRFTFCETENKIFKKIQTNKTLRKGINIMMLIFSLIFSREPSSTNNELSHPFSTIFLFKYILLVPEVKLYSPIMLSIFNILFLTMNTILIFLLGLIKGSVSPRLSSHTCFLFSLYPYHLEFHLLPWL